MRYNIILPINFERKEIHLVNGLQQGEEDNIFHKKNEIRARDEQAGIYHTYGDRVHGFNETRHFLQFLRPSPKDIIVELGCGTGRITEAIVSRGFYRYIAIDFSESSLRYLINKLDNETQNRILLIKADACYLPLKSQIADKILSVQAFEHIPGNKEQQNFIKELQRILNIKGLSALTVYNYNILKRFGWVNDGSQKGFHEGGIYYENFTLKVIEELFGPFFKIERLYGINCFFPMRTRLNEKVQQYIGFVLERLGLGRFLGNLLFCGIRVNN